MFSLEKDNLIIFRLLPKENVFEQLKSLCLKHNLKTGIFLSGIGQLGSVEIGFFKEKGNYLPQKLFQPLEILNISGFISFDKKNNDFDFHLHISLSDENKKVFGGHFIAGEVSITLEGAILKSKAEIIRQEEETGLKGMIL